VVSPRQRAANRANARKSTGPRTSWGKSRSSLNSTKHALTQRIDASLWGEHIKTINDLLVLEGIDPTKAFELAKRILDFERNLEHQRKRFLDLKEGRGPQYETPIGGLTDVYLARALDQASASKKPIFDEKLDKEIAKFLRILAIKEVRDAKREAEREVRSADRHYRRSANQLIKFLQTLY
jgi:hypothetical protein